ncbi:MAG: LacI family DNA-binding transcriptional regulator [Planctomycetota bacterium]|jgi:LacI family transcriptional regulator
MVTISEVAKKANVSRSTVSHVINSTRYVSEETRQRVEQAINELGYRPNILARSLRLGQTHTLGLILPDSSNTFFAEIGRGIEIAAFESGYNVILCNSEEDPQKESLYIDVLTKKQVDGIILTSTCSQGDALCSVNKLQIPIVLLDREITDLALDTVSTDNKAGGLIATNHLISLGHRRIGCIAGPSSTNPSAQRLIGYKQALSEAGIPFDEALVRNGDFHALSGLVMGNELLSMAEPPTAIFACNDMMAIGVLRAASERGIRVPNDLALVGFDDIELDSFTNPPLTTIAQPKLEMGSKATQFLIQRIKNPQHDLRYEMLPVSLVPRDSCGA